MCGLGLVTRMKPPGFRLLRDRAVVSAFCVTDTNGLRYLFPVTSEMRGVGVRRKACGEVGSLWCVELQALSCPRQAGEQSGGAVAELPIGDGSGGS